MLMTTLPDVRAKSSAPLWTMQTLLYGSACPTGSSRCLDEVLQATYHMEGTVLTIAYVCFDLRSNSLTAALHSTRYI